MTPNDASPTLRDDAPATVNDAGDRARAEARADRRCRLLLLLLVLIVWAPRLGAGSLDLRWDGGVYYVLGTSIAQGHGYRLLNEPGLPEAVQYPPLLPAFVAAHQLALATSDPAVVGPWLRVTYAALYALFALAAYALARRFLPPWLALMAAAIPVAQSLTLILSDLLFAELPFAIAALLMAVHVDRARAEERPGHDLLVGGLLGAVAVLLRTAGVALLGAWVGEALARRRWRLAAARAVVAALPVLAWQAHVAAVVSSDAWRAPAYEYQRAPYQFYNVPYSQNLSLLDPFRPERGPATAKALALRTVTNTARVPYLFGESVSSVDGYWQRVGYKVLKALRVEWSLVEVLIELVALPIALLGALALVGQRLLVARGDCFGPAYVALSTFMVCVTPWREQFARYLIPVQPFLAIGLVIAVVRVSAALRAAGRPRTARALTIGVGVLIAGIQAFSVQSALRYHMASPGGLHGVRRFNNDAGWNAMDRAIDWVGRATPPDAVIACVAPHDIWLRTGRRAVFVPFVEDPREVQRLLDGVPVTHVIVDQTGLLEMTDRHTLPAVVMHRDRWRLVFEHDRTRIYERVASDGR